MSSKKKPQQGARPNDSARPPVATLNVSPEPKNDGARDDPLREFWLTEYQVVVDQFHKYYDIHVKAFGVYLGVTALLFTTAYDKAPGMRSLMVAMGIIFSFAYFVVLLCELTIIRKLCIRRATALKKLITEEIADDFHPAGHWSCYIYFGVIAVVVSGWFYLHQLPDSKPITPAPLKVQLISEPQPTPPPPKEPIQVPPAPSATGNP